MTDTNPTDLRASSFGELVELTGENIPYHLRLSAPPLGECNRCSRKTWIESEFDTEDRVTQPDGNPCGGQIVRLM